MKWKPGPDHYWHFCQIKEGKPVLRDGSPAAKPGKTETHSGELEVCAQGLHMSPRALDALAYARDGWCRIVKPGEHIRFDSNKLVSNKRHVIHSFDATATLHEFACCVAEVALLLADSKDARSWQAIEAKRAWMRGECSDSDLEAAMDADRAATWAATRVALLAATWGALWAAAWGATRDEINTFLEEMLWEAASDDT